MKNKTLISIIAIAFYTLSSCGNRERIGAFQGDWYKKGFDIEAFTVRGDSMYFPGIDNGYFYQFQKDTLIVSFPTRKTKSLILSFSSEKLLLWDMTLSKDTLLLQRTPFDHINDDD